MDLRNDPRAAAAARRIQARTGFDVRDDAAVERVVTMCAARRSRARRSAAVSGALVAAVAAAWAAAAALGQMHGYELILGAVLLLLNGFRLVTAIAAVRRLARIPQSIEAARAEVQAAAAGPAVQPGLTPPSPGTARWN